MSPDLGINIEKHTNGKTTGTDSRKKPIYIGKRKFLGEKELVVSFYTTKCQFNCSYCALPSRSSDFFVSNTELINQIDDVIEHHCQKKDEFKRIAFGNEGSVLDFKRFHRDALNHFLLRLSRIESIRTVSLETRPEYVKFDELKWIKSLLDGRHIDVTVGFETLNDVLRQEILQKRISRRSMQTCIENISRIKGSLTSYVLVKPGPGMKDDEGRQEAISTINYLNDLCKACDVPFTAYLTPLYIAEGSALALSSRRDSWTPPRIQDILEIVLYCIDKQVPVYTGLWSEELADESSDFRGRADYEPEIRRILVEFNKTGNAQVLLREIMEFL